MTTSPYLYITTIYSYWRTSPSLHKLYNIQLQHFRAKFFYTMSVFVVYTLVQLKHNSILYYYTVAEIYIFLSDVGLQQKYNRRWAPRKNLEKTHWDVSSTAPLNFTPLSKIARYFLDFGELWFRNGTTWRKSNFAYWSRFWLRHFGQSFPKKCAIWHNFGLWGGAL